MNIFQLAKLCYESTQAFSEIMECKVRTPWEQLDEDSRNIVIEIITEVRVLHDPTTTPYDVHEIWMKVSSRYGWSYGKTKSKELKTSPCFVNYTQLSEIEKTKDKIVLSLVKAVKD